MAEMDIKVADLRTRITFQSPTLAQDAGGAQVPTYATIATNPTVWAQWINDHGQEAVSSEAVSFVQRATVRVRQRTDIQTTWRVLKDSEPWQVLSVDLVRGQNRWVELRVERVRGTL